MRVAVLSLLLCGCAGVVRQHGQDLAELQAMRRSEPPAGDARCLYWIARSQEVNRVEEVLLAGLPVVTVRASPDLERLVEDEQQRVCDL